MVRTIGGLSQVHGVLVVLALRRVYATATANNTHEVAQDVEPNSAAALPVTPLAG